MNNYENIISCFDISYALCYLGMAPHAPAEENERVLHVWFHEPGERDQDLAAMADEEESEVAEGTTPRANTSQAGGSTSMSQDENDKGTNAAIYVSSLVKSSSYIRSYY